MTGFEPVERWAWDAPVEERLAWLETALSPPQDRSEPSVSAWFETLKASPQIKQYPMFPKFTYTCMKVGDLAVEDTAGLIDVLDRTDAKVIHLVRDNRLKHALSLYRYHDEQKSQFGGQDKYAPTKVDFETFYKWLAESTRLHNQAMGVRDACVDRLGSDRVFPLTYEEFTDEEGKTDVLARLAAFFDIPVDFDGGRFSKATPDSLRQAISNYRAFKRHFRNTPHAEYLD